MFSYHRAALTFNFFAYLEDPQLIPWMSGQPCLSSLREMSSKRRWIMLLLNSSTAIAYVKSTSISQLGKLKNFGQQSRYHSPNSQACTCHFDACTTGQFFPIHSWCASSAIPRLGFRSIPSIVRVKTTFVRHSPRQSLPSRYSSFWVHLTRSDGHLPPHVDHP